MKKILAILTGGTIAGTKSEKGIAPGDSEKIKAFIKSKHDKTDFVQPFSLDSCLIGAGHWQNIGDIINERLKFYDGFLILHGTDTMAYTSCALSLMLNNISVPVVLTGAQIPFDMPNSDAENNIQFALKALEDDGLHGVFLAFDNKLFLGASCTKTDCDLPDAFSGVQYNSNNSADGDVGEFTYRRDFYNKVFVMKATPGTSGEILNAAVESGYKKIIIEAYGKGGLQSDLADIIGSLTKRGVTVAVTTQCRHGSVECNVYEVGKKLLESGAVELKNMTVEYAVVSMMME